MLPPEIWAVILFFSYLPEIIEKEESNNNDIKDLLSKRLIEKNTNIAFEELFILKIEISNYEKYYSNSSLFRMIKSFKNIKYLSLSKIPDLPIVFNYCLQILKKLEELHLNFLQSTTNYKEYSTNFVIPLNLKRIYLNQSNTELISNLKEQQLNNEIYKNLSIKILRPLQIKFINGSYLDILVDIDESVFKLKEQVIDLLKDYNCTLTAICCGMVLKDKQIIRDTKCMNVNNVVMMKSGKKNVTRHEL